MALSLVNVNKETLPMAKTPEVIVQNFVKQHALAERNLHLAYVNATRMAKGVEDGLRIGMVNGLDAKSFLWRHREALGKIGEAASFLAELHKEGQKFAEANGVDTGKLLSVGGVTLPAKKDGGR